MRNFECGAGRVNSEDGEGAVCNDFDFDTTSLLAEAGNLSSQTSFHTNDAPNTSMAPQDAVEFAIWKQISRKLCYMSIQYLITLFSIVKLGLWFRNIYKKNMTLFA